MNQHPVLSVVIPCWGRKEGTKSIINDVLNQTICNWEAIVIGDGCPDFQSLIDSGEMESFKERAKKLNSKLVYKNLEEHKGGYGYECLNTAISLAQSEFLIFAANDDKIYPNHFENYLNEINRTTDSVGIVAFSSIVYHLTSPFWRIRVPSYDLGYIGHSECIFRTKYIQNAPPHTPLCGHDWELIKHIVEQQNKEIFILRDTEPTYQVNARY